MMNLFKIIVWFAFPIVFVSCVDTNIEVVDYDSEIVVDGWIEQGKSAYVILSLSAPYFSDIDSTNLLEYSLTRAKVTLSDGEDEEILTLKPNDAYFPPYMYYSTRMKGELNKTYTLTVDYRGEQTIAKTTIPNPIILDSVWFALDDNKDSLGFLWIKYTDNVNSKDYYRSLTKVKNKEQRYIPNYIPNFNDEYFNGQDVEIALYKGNKSSIDKSDEFRYLLGDTILLKFSTIDKQSFDFWSSFQKEIMNVGNPFASSNARVASNVTNGLGVWCGYGSKYYEIVAK